MKIAVIIPTHNRPDMLEEALLSIISQNIPPQVILEIVVVDDASEPSVKLENIKKHCPYNILVYRNDSRNGLAYNRYKGANLSSADIIVHLDDDDKLNEESIRIIYNYFNNNANTDVLLLGIGGFGSRKLNLEENNRNGLNRVIRTTKNEINNNLIQFSENLFNALLIGVPLCFQNYAVRKHAWEDVSILRLKAYFDEVDPDQLEEKMQLLSGPLRDSEWIIYASLIKNIALIDEPLYLVRCEGQGTVSHISKRPKQVEANIAIKKRLLLASATIPNFKIHKKDIRLNLADTLFGEAYYQLNTLKSRKFCIKYLISAIKVKIQFKYFKLLIKNYLPNL